MATKPARQISRATYLQAMGLYTLASIHQRKCSEAEAELNNLIDHPNDFGSHISDEIYSPGHHGGFDKALKLMGITVRPERAKKAK